MFRRLQLLGGALVGRLTKRMLGPHIYALLVRSENGLFAVDPEDSGVGRQLRVSGKWAAEELERLKSFLTKDSNVLVVGAHIGTLAIPISRLCRQVLAIEANPASYGLLATNIGLNSATNCTALNIAASDKNEDLPFLLNTANSGGSKRSPRRKEFAYYYDSPKEISVKAVRLDDYLESHAFDLVVMDIEGSEIFALKGMQDILAQSGILVVEFLPHHLRNVGGATAAEFLSTIAPHFSRMTVPPDDRKVAAADFLARLQSMYDRNQGNDGIIFEKERGTTAPGE